MNKQKRAYKNRSVANKGIQVTIRAIDATDNPDPEGGYLWYWPPHKQAVVLAKYERGFYLVRYCETGIITVMGQCFIWPRRKAERWRCTTKNYSKHDLKWLTFLAQSDLLPVAEWCKRHKHAFIGKVLTQSGLFASEDEAYDALFEGKLSLNGRLLESTMEFLPLNTSFTVLSPHTHQPQDPLPHAVSYEF